MNCWHCNTELIWGGDNECPFAEEYSFVTNLHCPKCESYVEVYYPKRDEGNSMGNMAISKHSLV